MTAARAEREAKTKVNTATTDFIVMVREGYGGIAPADRGPTADLLIQVRATLIEMINGMTAANVRCLEDKG
jgi:hypothetical protein